MFPIPSSTYNEEYLDLILKANSNYSQKIANPQLEKFRTLSPFNRLEDMNIVSFIFSFLNHMDFNKFRTLNKTFKEFADSPELYSRYHFVLKTVFVAHNDKQIEVRNKNNEVKTKENEIKTPLANQRAVLMNQLFERNNSWFQYLVSLINFYPGGFSAITEIFSSIFPSIKEELEIRNGLSGQINALSSRIRNIENYNFWDQNVLINQLLTERNKLIEEASKLNEQISNLKTYQKILIEKEANTEKFIASLFGGKANIKHCRY